MSDITDLAAELAKADVILSEGMTRANERRALLIKFGVQS
jgi:hypothetical protein